MISNLMLGICRSRVVGAVGGVKVSLVANRIRGQTVNPKPSNFSMNFVDEIVFENCDKKCGSRRRIEIPYFARSPRRRHPFLLAFYVILDGFCIWSHIIDFTLFSVCDVILWPGSKLLGWRFAHAVNFVCVRVRRFLCPKLSNGRWNNKCCGWPFCTGSVNLRSLCASVCRLCQWKNRIHISGLKSIHSTLEPHKVYLLFTQVLFPPSLRSGFSDLWTVFLRTHCVSNTIKIIKILIHFSDSLGSLTYGRFFIFFPFLFVQASGTYARRRWRSTNAHWLHSLTKCLPFLIIIIPNTHTWLGC